MINQLNLFTEIINIYSESKVPVSNEVLYKRVIKKLSLPESVFLEMQSASAGGPSYNIFKRKIRWFQQTLKHAGVLNKVDGERGKWCAAKLKADDLDKILPSLSVIGFSTRLGVAILGYSESVFSGINEPIHLILTSPPYPLSNPRKYGNVKESEYVDWVCTTLEPVIKNLAVGGSLVLNVGNDVFLKGSPARSLYKERLLLALNDRFGLSLMDQIIWHNGSKAPGPIAWASKQRVQLNVAWEPLYWFTNDPLKVLSNNQRVLQPHSPKHLDFVMSGGAKKAEIKSDGAYKIREGSYSNLTAGKIQRNVISIGHSCADNRAYRKNAIKEGLVPHGATMPLKLASFMIEFLTEPGHLVVDSFAGSMTVGRAAETLGRRWMCVDPVVDYVKGAAFRFEGCDGFRRGL